MLKFLNKFPQTQQFWNRDRVTLLLLLFACLFLYEVFHFWPNIIGLHDPKVFQGHKISGISLHGTEFWDAHDKKHGYVRLNSNELDLQKRNHVCQGFFAIWPSDCVDKYDDLDMKLKVLSAQMVLMNTTLTLFVTDMLQCEFQHNAIRVEKFDSIELLKENGFENTLSIMDTWPKTRYTRISDILRLALAKKYSMSYIDTDVTFLRLHKDLYEKSYVGAALWSNAKNAIEITNGAFCLPSNILDDMMAFQKSRILNGSDKYFYTELGPSMFHNVLMNRHEVTLYSQNNPAEPSLDEIARAIVQYGHMHLHLTGHVRKGNPNLNFGEIVNTIRSKAGLPLLVFK